MAEENPNPQPPPPPPPPPPVKREEPEPHPEGSPLAHFEWGVKEYEYKGFLVD